MRKSLREKEAERKVWDFEGLTAESQEKLVEEVEATKGVSEVKFLKEKQVIIYKVDEEVFGAVVHWNPYDPDDFQVCVSAIFKVLGTDLEQSIDAALEEYKHWWD